jgi:hypothetical protein
MANGTLAASQIEMLSQSGTGIITVVPPATNTNRTLTLPDNSGTVITTGSTFAGTGPAFSAYRATAQSLSSSVTTKVQFNLEEFDTAGAFDSTTNFRFQPSVAGYYNLNAGVLFSMNSTAGTYFAAIHKSGSDYKRGSTIGGSNVQNVMPTVSSLIYLNGTTDYAEVFAFQNSGGSLNVTGFDTAVYVYFNGALVRAA